MKIINLPSVGIPARLEVVTEHGHVVGTLEGNALCTSLGGGINKVIVAIQTRTSHQISSISHYYVVNLEKY